MPKTEREKLMADKEEMTNNRSGYVIELRTLSDVIKKAFRQNLSPIIENFKNQQEKVNFEMVILSLITHYLKICTFENIIDFCKDIH